MTIRRPSSNWKSTEVLSSPVGSGGSGGSRERGSENEVPISVKLQKGGSLSGGSNSQAIREHVAMRDTTNQRRMQRYV